MEGIKFQRPPIPMPRPMESIITPNPPRPKPDINVDDYAHYIKCYRVGQACFYAICFVTTVIVVVSFSQAFITVVLAEKNSLNMWLIGVYFIHELTSHLTRVAILGVWLSVGMIAYVHMLHAKIAVQTPLKRYQLIQENLKLPMLCHMFVVGFGCTMFVKSVATLLKVPLDVVVECKEISDEYSPLSDYVCVHQKNLFILLSVFIVTMWEFIQKNMINNYKIKFFYLHKKMSDQIKSSILHTWKKPFVHSIILLPWIFLFFRFSLEMVFTIWKGFHAVEYALSEWDDAVDIFLMLKTIVWCSVGLNLFVYLWVCANFMLVQKPNFLVDKIIPDNTAMLLKHAISAKDPYLKAIGFFDLMYMVKGRGQKLDRLFALSHPGNKPNNWNSIINNCLGCGKQMEQTYDEYISRYTNDAKATLEKNTSKPQVPVRPGIGLTIYNSEPHCISNVPDTNLRSRARMIGRDLANSEWILRAPRPPVKLNRGKKFMKHSANVVADVRATVKSHIGTVQQLVKTQLSWSYWTSDDPELEIANLLSDHFVLIWIFHGMVDVLCYAVSCEANVIIQQDVFRITKFIIETYDTITKLGEAVRSVQSERSSTNKEQTLLSKEIEDQYSRLHSSIKSSVVQYSAHFSQYFGILSIPPGMQRAIHQIVDCEN